MRKQVVCRRSYFKKKLSFRAGDNGHWFAMTVFFMPPVFKILDGAQVSLLWRADCADWQKVESTSVQNVESSTKLEKSENNYCIFTENVVR